MKYIVSDEHKFIYFVVQKVACTSIKSALLPLFDFSAAGREMVSKQGSPNSGIHKLFDNSGYQIRKQQLIKELDGEYRDYFKFAFVRNPWDRLVSCYFQKLADVKEEDFGKPASLKFSAAERAELYYGMPFAEFVEAVYDVPDEEANIHFRSQYKVICGRGRDKPIMADFVGRFENLAQDFEAVTEKIGVAEKVQLPHKLRSRGRESRSYAEFYDNRLRDLVHERYLDDIEIFGYSF
jgi:hypothetical protein